MTLKRDYISYRPATTTPKSVVSSTVTAFPILRQSFYMMRSDSGICIICMPKVKTTS